MKIITWNVNGIRSLKKSVDCILTELSCDIACFQETKVSRGQIPETTAIVKDFTSYFSYPRKQSGYSGVATYCCDKFTPEDAVEALNVSQPSLNDVQGENALTTWELSSTDVSKFDSEGRVITTYHLIRYKENIRRLAIINVYCPRVDPEKLERHVYKMQFCLLLEAKIRELCKKGCSVILVGDLNIVHSMIDHCDPCDEREFNSSEVRQWLKSFLLSEITFLNEHVTVIDAFRHFYPNGKEAYTCWNTKTNARLTNYGTRIDYILITSDLIPLLQSCEILSDYLGSDHCPIEAVFKCESIRENNVQLPSICTRLWPEYSGQQQTLQAFFQKAQDIADNVTNTKDIPTQSQRKPTAKKDKQKSIMSFFKKPNTSSTNDINAMNRVSSHNITENTEQLDKVPTSSQPFIISENVDEKCSDIGSSEACSGALAWKGILSGLPKPPLCSGHQKECVFRTVKKKGPNCGRNFYMCAQPAGHVSNPDASCNFFKWVNPPKINRLK